jgi:hypothetical protein
MPGASRQPRIAMEIIIESAALYSLSALVFTPMLADLSFTARVGTYAQYAEIFFAYMTVESYPSCFLSPIPDFPAQNFAPALIMLRVVLGRARPDTEWSGKHSDLQFNSTPGAQESASSTGVTSTILTVPGNHRWEEADLEVNGEPRTETMNGEKRMGRTDDEESARI